MLASKTPADFEAERLREAVREELAKNKGTGKSKKAGKGPGVFNQNRYTVDIEEAELVMCNDEIDLEYRKTIVSSLVHPRDAPNKLEIPIRPGWGTAARGARMVEAAAARDMQPRRTKARMAKARVASL